MARQTLALITAALWLLSPAWADVTATVAMSQGLGLNLDTGALGAPESSDLLYSGPGGLLIPFGSGTFMTSVNDSFAELTEGRLSSLTTYTKNPIAESSLVQGVVIAVRTNTGKYSKIQVANKVAGILFLTFQTYTTSAQLPTILSLQNNYGHTLPNFAVAPGSLFFIKGRNLSNVNDGQTLRSSAAPGLQNTVSGVTVTVTVNGISLNCPLYYLSPEQINAVLPGGTPLGRGTITVTNNQDKSEAFSITVAQSAFGIVNYNGTLAATYDAGNALITSFNAANPGQTIVIWGSGVGGDPANDDRLFPQKTNDLVNVPMQVLVGGRQATLLYHGRSQFPGVDQVVVTLPANVPTGCYVSLSVITGDTVSNGVTIPVAASGKTCSDAGDRLTPALIRTLSAQPTVRTGELFVIRYSYLSNNTSTLLVGGSFSSVTGFGLTAGADSLSVGNCLVRSSLDLPSQTNTPLDAGPSIQVNGPAGSLLLNRVEKSMFTIYESAIPASFVPAAGGSFAFFNSPAGPNGVRFDTNLHLPLNFAWTNPAALAVVDPRGATVTWTGGSTGPSDSGASWVEISGTSYAESRPVFFTCKAPTNAGQFTIPASVLMAMPRGMAFLSVAARGQLAYASGGVDLLYLRGTVNITREVSY